MRGYIMMGALAYTPPNPIAFRLGGIEVRWYGIILTSAMIVGLIMMIYMGKKKKLNSDDSLELFLWLIPLAVVFARVIYVFANSRQYGYFPIKSWGDFVDVIAIWDGGITIYGGIFGGVIGAYIFSKRKKISLGMILDIMVPIMLLCQSLGRWGNFFNQEAYGQAVTNPNLQWFPMSVFIEGNLGTEAGWYQATFFYEGIVNFVGAILMYCLWRKNKVNGALVAPYIVWYCMIRLILDHLRVDGLLSTKVACAIMIPLGIGLGIWYYLRGLKRLDHDKVKAEVQLMLNNDD